MKKLLLLTSLFLAAGQAAAQAPPGFSPSGPTATCAVPTALSVSGASSRTALGAVNPCGASVVLYNVGTQEVFYRLGDNTAVATITDNSLPAGSFVVLSILVSQTNVAAITAAATSTVRVLQGTNH